MYAKQRTVRYDRANEIIFHTKTAAPAPAIEAHITTRTMSKNGNSIETRHKNLFSSNTTSPHSSSTSCVFVCLCCLNYMLSALNREYTSTHLSLLILFFLFAFFLPHSIPFAFDGAVHLPEQSISTWLHHSPTIIIRITELILRLVFDVCIVAIYFKIPLSNHSHAFVIVFAL